MSNRQQPGLEETAKIAVFAGQSGPVLDLIAEDVPIMADIGPFRGIATLRAEHRIRIY
jgi:hypothetical protein